MKLEAKYTGDYGTRTMPKGVRLEVFERDGWRCRFCGESNKRHLRVDHVHPQVRGGGDDLDNLWALCLWCNAKKATKLLPFQLPFAQKIMWPRKRRAVRRLRSGGFELGWEWS